MVNADGDVRPVGQRERKDGSTNGVPGGLPRLTLKAAADPSADGGIHGNPPN